MKREPEQFTAGGGGANIFQAALLAILKEWARVKRNRWGTGRIAVAFILFIFLAGYQAPVVFSAAGPVRVGEKAPQFDIQGFNSQELMGKKNILLVFYRGHF
jgi:hypothetical protein